MIAVIRRYYQIQVHLGQASFQQEVQSVLRIVNAKNKPRAHRDYDNAGDEFQGLFKDDMSCYI